MTFLKQLHWKYLGLLLLFIVIAAIVNNALQPAEKSVTWIGGQEVLAKPEAE